MSVSAVQEKRFPNGMVVYYFLTKSQLGPQQSVFSYFRWEDVLYEVFALNYRDTQKMLKDTWRIVGSIQFHSG